MLGSTSQKIVRVPEVLAADFHQGFMLLEDFGDALLRPALTPATVDALYAKAMDALLHLQHCDDVPGHALPAYDRQRLTDEMALLRDWFVARYLGLALNTEQQAVLENAFVSIVEAVQAQPQVFVHRDYHSRNLMLLADGGLGVIDFQDAVTGPVTYDLVSLLRDAYVMWDEDVQIDYAVRYWERARQAGLPVPDDFGDFWRDFEWMGLQRHLKVLGIFARLALRDGKRQYLDDIPRVWSYAHRVASRYQGLGPLARLLERAEAPHGGTQTQVGYTF